MNIQQAQSARHASSASTETANTTATPYYTVQRGDTLSSIAKQQGLTMDVLFAANPRILNPDCIYPGDRINLPEPKNNADGALQEYISDASTFIHEILVPLPKAVAKLLSGVFTAEGTEKNTHNTTSNHNTESNPATQNDHNATTSNKTPAPWLSIASQEKNQKEIPGLAANPRIVEYHSTTTLRAISDETPWCSSFMNWVMNKNGINGTGSASAISWKNWGQSTELKPGAVVVVRGPLGHHVGLYLGGEEGSLKLLGGNQGNKVKESTYGSEYSIVAIRWPNQL